MARPHVVSVNGVELEYVEEGSGAPVVFSHGGSSDVRYWEPQRAAVAARYQFVAFSRRFHGAGSWAPDADASSEAHASDLVEIVRVILPSVTHFMSYQRPEVFNRTVMNFLAEH